MAQSPVLEPNFEGEEMKLPESAVEVDNTAPATGSLVSAPILILLFAILVSLLGGIYYWYTILMATPVNVPAPTRPTAEMNNEPESTTVEARTSATDVVSTSDDIDAIGADAESTQIEDLNTLMQPIENELNAAIPAS
jgi:hypothetical protein